MTRLNALISFIFTRTFYHKAIAYGILVLFLYFFSSFALIFFLTFIFAFLFYSSAKFIKEKIYEFLCTRIKNEKYKIFFKKYFNLNIIIIIEYILFLVIIIWIISNTVPKIQTELTGLSETIPVLGEQLQNVKDVLWNINKNYSEIDATVKNVFKSDNINYDVIFSIFKQIENAWNIILKFIFSLILSFVFLLDRKKLKKYLAWIKKSNFSFLYEEYKVIFDKIIKSFGLILKAQASIAVINTIITIVWFYIIWLFFGWFSYILTMAIVVFIFSFIPILWMWLSAVPLVTIAYLTWGFNAWFLVFWMIILTTAFEAYFLNPKIVSNLFNVPMSLTLVILFIWWKLFWIAWLLVWISLFYFIIWLLKDIDEAISKKNKVKKIETKIIKRVKKSA